MLKRKELRDAYEVLKIWTLVITDSATTEEGIKIAEEHIRDLKRSLRKENAMDNAATKRYMVRDYGIDGWVERIAVPFAAEDEDEVNEWFINTEFMEAPHSMYDCTGALFTSWWKPCKLNGRWFVYHSIVRDC